MTDRMKLEFDTPQHLDAAEAVEQIAVEMMNGDESGTIADGHDGDRIEWRFEEGGAGIEIDRRQRLAAAALIMGFDLPQEMMAASRSMLEAASLLPGMTTGDLAPMGGQGRRHALQMAKGLIDEMLSEAEGAPTPDDTVQVLRVFRLPVELDEALRRMSQRDDVRFEDLVIKAVRNLIAEDRQK